MSKGSINVGGKNIRDVHKYGVLTFHDVIQKASNVGSIMIGMKLGKERIYKYAKLLGIGEKTGIDLPGEVSGWIYSPERWSGTSLGAIPIGQEVAVTPLQILRAYAAIANGGYLVKPHVVSEILSPEGEVITSFRNPERQRILSSRTTRHIQGNTRECHRGGGNREERSGGRQSCCREDRYRTAMFNPVTKRYSKEKYVSCSVGFVPADNPRLAMIVVVYEPKGQIYGGVVAAPVFREIANQALSNMGIPGMILLNRLIL